MNDQSLLRRNLQIRPLDAGELPLYRKEAGKKAHIIQEDGQKVLRTRHIQEPHKGKGSLQIYVPLFEIACNVEAVQKFSSASWFRFPN